MLMSEDPYLPTFLVLKLSWKQKKNVNKQQKTTHEKSWKEGITSPHSVEAR